MISLKDTVEMELVSGKKLFEKLKLKNIKSDTIDLDIPKCEFNELSDEVYNITLPNKKYFIYKDYYRYKSAHLASIDDMCVNFSMFFSDFEDFDPQKDILFASDDYKEIAEWYIKNVFNHNLPSSKDDWDDWYSNLDKRKVKYKYHDSEYFIFHLLFDEEKIDQYYNDKEPFNNKILNEIIQQYFC